MLVPFVVVMKLLYRIFQVKSSEIQGQGALKSHRFGRKSEEICRNSTEIFWKGRGSFGQCSNTSHSSNSDSLLYMLQRELLVLPIRYSGNVAV